MNWIQLPSGQFVNLALITNMDTDGRYAWLPFAIKDSTGTYQDSLTLESDDAAALVDYLASISLQLPRLLHKESNE